MAAEKAPKLVPYPLSHYEEIPAATSLIELALAAYHSGGLENPGSPPIVSLFRYALLAPILQQHRPGAAAVNNHKAGVAIRFCINLSKDTPWLYKRLQREALQALRKWYADGPPYLLSGRRRRETKKHEARIALVEGYCLAAGLLTKKQVADFALEASPARKESRPSEATKIKIADLTAKTYELSPENLLSEVSEKFHQGGWGKPSTHEAQRTFLKGCCAALVFQQNLSQDRIEKLIKTTKDMRFKSTGSDADMALKLWCKMRLETLYYGPPKNPLEKKRSRLLLDDIRIANVEKFLLATSLFTLDELIALPHRPASLRPPESSSSESEGCDEEPSTEEEPAAKRDDFPAIAGLLESEDESWSDIKSDIEDDLDSDLAF